MIYYENTDWKAFLRLNGSVIQKAAKFSTTFALASLLFSLFIKNWGYVTGLEHIDIEMLRSMDFGARLRDFTFVLGFFIAFCAQKAYGRWWEGGTLLQQLRGEWFNAFSSLLAFSSTDPKLQPEVQRFQHMVARMISLMYANALNQVSSVQRTYELIDISGFDIEAMEFLNSSHDGCEVALHWVQKAIVEAHANGIIDIAPPILSRVYNQLGNGVVRLSNARKIHEFPIPFPIGQMVWFQLIFHGILTALTCAILVDSYIPAFTFTFLVSQSIWTIHFITLELEQPFGSDSNDLPLEEMAIDLNDSICHLLNPKAQKPLQFTFDAAYDSELLREPIHLGDYIAMVKDGTDDKPFLSYHLGTSIRMQRAASSASHRPRRMKLFRRRARTKSTESCEGDKKYVNSNPSPSSTTGGDTTSRSAAEVGASDLTCTEGKPLADVLGSTSLSIAHHMSPTDTCPEVSVDGCDRETLERQTSRHNADSPSGLRAIPDAQMAPRVLVSSV
eukprot:TRINITY_DN10075_c0_g1_i1.p1 TRINITY_DN10075_c0_g1~~TRINITY_DN10075_c0_g1_i1.p1  ORF type:complete len:502 (-),score=57.51 TRINITY_DN10075_c0_g1_i1:175-1680(-)